MLFNRNPLAIVLYRISTCAINGTLVYFLLLTVAWFSTKDDVPKHRNWSTFAVVKRATCPYSYTATEHTWRRHSFSGIHRRAINTLSLSNIAFN